MFLWSEILGPETKHNNINDSYLDLPIYLADLFAHFFLFQPTASFQVHFSF